MIIELSYPYSDIRLSLELDLQSVSGQLQLA